MQSSGPGAVRVADGTIRLNTDRSESERRTLVVLNTGDRPVQIGSHIHLAEVNSALDFDRDAAEGFRLDIPAGTSRRFEPGASREVAIVAFKGARRVPGLQIKPSQIKPSQIKPSQIKPSQIKPSQIKPSQIKEA